MNIADYSQIFRNGCNVIINILILEMQMLWGSYEGLLMLMNIYTRGLGLSSNYGPNSISYDNCLQAVYFR